MTDIPSHGLIKREISYEGRAMNKTESLLIQWGCTERQAIVLARNIPEGTADIERAVTAALVSALEKTGGKTRVTYMGGERRDTLR